RELLAGLDRRIRVVLLMSQCYSGAFARAGAPADGAAGTWRTDVCGYFSSTADRPAYGCHPENRGVDDVGHSFHFLHALGRGGSFPAAHDAVLVTDDSPDVPLRTSDMFLEDVLRRAAEAEGRDMVVFTDEMLREAWTDRAAWEPQIRLLDRIAHDYGMFSPRSLSELDELAHRLPAVSGEPRRSARGGGGGLHAASRANLERSRADHPEWKPRLDDQALKESSEAERRKTSAQLLGELGPFTRSHRSASARLELLNQNA